MRTTNQRREEKLISSFATIPFLFSLSFFFLPLLSCLFISSIIQSNYQLPSTRLISLFLPCFLPSSIAFLPSFLHSFLHSFIHSFHQPGGKVIMRSDIGAFGATKSAVRTRNSFLFEIYFVVMKVFLSSSSFFLYAPYLSSLFLLVSFHPRLSFRYYYCCEFHLFPFHSYRRVYIILPYSTFTICTVTLHAFLPPSLLTSKYLYLCLCLYRLAILCPPPL